ncbi:LacI family DNA-binding transcriptional regulator [Symbiopectobacterium purcellii]|uniref:LacI family DNA-binding transcriptional regulator n=1 Tax=Symbiopectobacterium purcellii TaxID=2871826 RepID=A0ABX9APX9_9ENTR|nr:LacI family DNA-binding transcriptional regulator [Symbiopectobacterium purcellii]QZN96798.1 LacI family DNA-binding transcriptional regulator [Symbiopectobacterium purcellii]
MTTILEVAKKAGVAKSTVSRVLSGNGYVSQETKDRVFKAIEESGYRPNLLARNLAAQKSQTIGLVITNTLYHGTYFSELLFQAAKMTEAHGRQLLLVDGKHSAEEERAAIQFLIDLRCDAIIIYPRFLTIDEMDQIISQHKQPIMVLNRRLRVNDSYCIYSDQHESSRNAVNHLIEQGHREIAFITGALDSPTGMERLAGYKAALEQHAIPVDERRIVLGKWALTNGVEAVNTLLDHQVSFSALVASNDDMAIGALKQLYTRGIGVPEQVSVIGFDDLPTAAFTIPSLSSVKMPLGEMIQEIINRLLSMLDGGTLRQRKAYPASLILRNSVTTGPFYR